MIVANKLSGDTMVNAVGRTRTIFESLRRRLHSEVIDRQFAQYRATRPSHLELFSDDRVPDPDVVPRALLQADVYHLHWVAGFLDYRAFFHQVPSGTALVWTLHDMNPFTGGCHYAAGCEKFTEACGACPALGSTNEADLSAAIFRRKHSAYDRLTPEKVRIVAASRWMSREASRSALLRRFRISTIPYGLDTDTFQPRNRAVAREVFGIPQDIKLVMCAAQSLQNHRKGMDLLISALNAVNSDREIGLLSVGAGQFTAPIRQRCFHLGRLDNERLLSFAYSAADIFISPAREEAFGQVVLEAMACGTPVIAFNVGGIPDMVRSGNTGFLALPGDVLALREGVETLLHDDEGCARMSRECRRVAVEEYGLELQAERYRQVYEELLAPARGAEPSAMAEQSLSESVHALPHFR